MTEPEVQHGWRRTFAALSIRNFRLYFIGQLVSVSGTWLQSFALGLLVLHLSHSFTDVGYSTALQFTPMLLLGSWAGLVVDRSRKRPILYATQVVALVQALLLGFLASGHHTRLASVFALSLVTGFVNLIDNPTRQTFVQEMVGPTMLPNAVSLNSVLMNLARVVGPGLGGIFVATVGLSGCFYVNAASYVAVLLALAAMRADELHPTTPVRHERGQVRQGLRYVWRTRVLRGPLLAMTVIGILAFNFNITLLALAKGTFRGSASTVSHFMVAMGVGAVVGGLRVAHHGKPSARRLAGLGIGFAIAMVGVALSPTVLVAVGCTVLVGYGSIAFVATANGTLQVNSTPQMRGRVMALYAIAFLGSSPIGGPLVGAIAQAASPRVAILVGAIATFGASVLLGVDAARHEGSSTTR